LSGQPGIFIVGEADNGAEMITKYEELKPDLVISDIEMLPLNGIEALKQLKLKYPDIKVLFVSIYVGIPEYIYLIIKAGGLGLLGKSSARGELLYAINEAMEGRQYFGPNFNNEQIAAIMDKYNHPPKKFNIDPSKIPTDIEDKILLLIGEGLTSNEIADKLSRSRRTIDTHRQDIMEKFGLENVNKLIVFAAKYLVYKENEENAGELKPAP
jgi:DNA-binding NarL/FixJ family response regulator